MSAPLGTGRRCEKAPPTPSPARGAPDSGPSPGPQLHRLGRPFQGQPGVARRVCVLRGWLHGGPCCQAPGGGKEGWEAPQERHFSPSPDSEFSLGLEVAAESQRTCSPVWSAIGPEPAWLGEGRGGGSSLDTLDICTPAACPPLAAGPCAVSSVSSSEKGEWHPRTVLCCADSGDTAQMLAKAARSH